MAGAAVTKRVVCRRRSLGSGYDIVRACGSREGRLTTLCGCVDESKSPTVFRD